ncbi:uncharacterized protein LOC125040976 isoform X3 [Penaeus chinensis]|uniref:uncharacterized protein LOC125040976 isoform X3 n=1 Tax=Penaeus chinensis TaxID=139456 RepID=UPI001FB6E40D|nr:uncharacterized protein LOC125040976 isoform X3 [Penaeus chinensis]XP_047491750.1 uncharacterized protein LOC125040976 isoform X3 [Penaeus chinensis]
MAVAAEDAGVTLVSFSRSRPTHRTCHRAHEPSPPPGFPRVGGRRPGRSGRRSLSRLLGRCADTQEEDEPHYSGGSRLPSTPRHDPPEAAQAPLPPPHPGHPRGLPSVVADAERHCPATPDALPRLGPSLPDLPDSPQHDRDKIKLVGFKRSHSFCVEAQRPAGGRPPSVSHSAAFGADSGGAGEAPWPHECHTLKTSREVKMERERLRRSRAGDTAAAALWSNMDKDDVFANFMRESQSRFSSLLEERGFTHIPPPAGFGAPTRPTSLLAALACGPTSLDEAELSGAASRRAASRRAAYTMKRSATGGFPPPPQPQPTHAHEDKENQHEDARASSEALPETSSPAPPPPASSSSSTSALKEEVEEEEEGGPWGDLPASPLSPPSPFHHPFFRRQLGLPTPVADPWARFSGFGMPRLPQVLLTHAQAQQEAAAGGRRGEEWGEEQGGGEGKESERGAEDEGEGGGGGGRDRVERRRHSANPCVAPRGSYCVSARHSVVRYCNDTHSYNLPRVCTETQFFSEDFGEGVSETESEDEEEFVTPTGGVGGVAEGSTNTHQAQTSAHAQRSSSSRSGSRPPSPSAGKTQARSQSRPHSPLSDMDTESKRNSQAVSTEPSEIDDHSSVRSSDLESCHDLSSPRSSLLAQDTASVHELDHTVDARKDKAYRIAHELLNTERTYVKVLHLIDQEFQFRVDQENRAHHLFPADIIPQMFSNVKSIYKLHHDFLLPQLEERMAQWEQNRRIGDIMKSFAPFLKMYTEYVRNFDNAMTIINAWQAKCPRFSAIMDEIHSMEVCGNLTLQHHMLSPVQRIPRYEMLLREYLKKLPEDSPDRHDTEKALHLVSTAANHANDAMKKIDKFEKLLEIQESLGGAVDLVSPTRELVKEGKIIKISARSGDHQERYVFLLTDLLLLCSPRLMGSRVMSGPQYRLRARYNVENLQVHEGDNLETANTFYIRDDNKSVELYTQTIEEKEQWLEALFRAIHETYQRKSSLKLHCNPDQRVVDLDLGQKQPTLIRSDSVTKCMECGSQFTMVRRKHHCRACGAVVCSKCSSFKASLAYDSGKNVRVCRTCHATLQELSSSTATPSPEITEGDECSIHTIKEPPDLAFRSRGVLEVSAAADGAVAQGFLQLKTHRKAWVKRWFALHTDFVLYSFKCDMDDQALTATPVPGFTVTHLQGTRNESGINDKEKERAFKLHHSKKQYIFLAASKEDSLRWVAALKKASQAELPSPVQ